MDPRAIRAVLLGVVLGLVAGCRAYEPRPLDARRILAEVDRRRAGGGTTTGSDADDQVTFVQAAQWMRRHGPELQELIAAWRRARARSDVPTPLPDPGVMVGPEYAFGDAITMKRVAPFGSLSLRIPLGDRRDRQDDLERLLSERARIEGLARHRELTLELRRRWLRRVFAGRIEGAREDLVRATGLSIETARRMVEAGQSTALDVALFRLEQGRARAGALAARGLRAEATADLAELVGVRGERFDSLAEDDLPPLPPAPPDLEALRGQLIDALPELGRLRADYEVSEARLRLEVARQYPDLTLGPQFADEAGERRTALGLSLGIRLPLFDGNVEEIVVAEAAREEARARFEAAANRALGRLERAWARVRLAAEQHALLRDAVLRQVAESLDLARRSLAAGTGDALRLLDAERSHREVRVEVLGAERALGDAWCDLEQAVGRPLLRFPSEEAAAPDAGTAPPAALRETAATDETTDAEERR